MAEADCIFCKIVAGDLPARKVHEDEDVLAFMDINPWTRGHMLVIPKRHARDLLEIGPDDLAACSAVAQTLARRATEALGADGVNLLNACGATAWQTVFHFHLHVIPRYPDDAMRPPRIPQPVDDAEIEAAAEALRA